jgi:hypothetical protein
VARAKDLAGISKLRERRTTMRKLTLLVVFALSASAAPHSSLEPAQVVAAYHALTPQQLAARPGAKVPSGTWERVDVSDRIRSASFGHTTTLAYRKAEGVFYVEYGRSTNTPAQTFGPFSVQRAADAGTGAAGVRCGPNTCARGEICCNPSCGICTPPDGFCTEQFCETTDAGR